MDTTDAGTIVVRGARREDVISARRVYVAPGAEFVGDISARIVQVLGKVTGDITANEIYLLATSAVRGRLACGYLAVEPGAKVDFDVECVPVLEDLSHRDSSLGIRARTATVTSDPNPGKSTNHAESTRSAPRLRLGLILDEHEGSIRLSRADAGGRRAGTVPGDGGATSSYERDRQSSRGIPLPSLFS